MTATFSNKKVGYTYCSCLPRVAFMEWSFSSCSRILCVKRFLGSVASIVASFSKIVMPSSPVPTPLWTYVALFFLEVLVTSNKLLVQILTLGGFKVHAIYGQVLQPQDIDQSRHLNKMALYGPTGTLRGEMLLDQLEWEGSSFRESTKFIAPIVTPG